MGRAIAFLATMACVPHLLAAPPPAAPPAAAKVFVSPIAPDLAIVTEVSLDTPCVGQQFSVIYRLRARRPPAAVDIDPQQFAGFWTEMVPVPPQSTARMRQLPETGTFEYLLRQVIAFPLLEGSQQIPPLSLKVKMAGRVSPERNDWDLVAGSAPVAVSVAPVPPRQEPLAGLPCVGRIEGAVAWEEQPAALLLEIQGTANLAVFRPLDWLRGPQGPKLRAQLVAADNLTQTIDREGNRQLSLVQRQRWRISVSGGRAGEALGSLSIPVYDPGAHAWQEVRFDCGAVPPYAASADAGESGGEPASAPVEPRPRFPGMARALWFAGIAAAAAGIAWILSRSVRRAGRKENPEDIVAGLRKKLKTSPRAFLEGAEKVLVQMAEAPISIQYQETYQCLLSHCRISLEEYRYSRETLPGAAAENLIEALGELLRSRRGL